MMWSWLKKKEGIIFFVPFILSKANFFNICVLSQCIVYWMQHFQNIHTFSYQKTLLHPLFVACFWNFRKRTLNCILKFEIWNLKFVFEIFESVPLIVSCQNRYYSRKSYSKVNIGKYTKIFPRLYQSKLWHVFVWNFKKSIDHFLITILSVRRMKISIESAQATRPN